MRSFVKPSARAKFGLAAVSTAALIVNPLGVSPASAADFSVTSCDDSGANTFRQAVLDANANAGADVIDFNVAGSCTILVESTITITEELDVQNTSGQPVTLTRADDYVYVAGYYEPGYYQNGTYYPGYTLPGYYQNGPWVAGFTGPGTNLPGTNLPGSTSPGMCVYLGVSYQSLACSFPYQYVPGIYTPGPYVPGTYVPGTYYPGYYQPGSYIPGEYVEPYTAPGQQINGPYVAPSSYTNQNTSALVLVDVDATGAVVTFDDVNFNGASENATEAMLVVADNSVPTLVYVSDASMSYAKARAIDFRPTLGSLDLDGVTFASNQAVQGGAIKSLGDVDIIDSTFSDNSATEGGAIAVFDSYVSITSSSFTSNTATDDGGALYAKGSYIHFASGTVEFEYNDATGRTGTDGRGGAIFTRESTLGTQLVSDANLVFTGNTAGTYGASFDGYGGAIYMAATGLSELTFNSTVEFDQNTAYGNLGAGGAISFNSLTLQNGTFFAKFNGNTYFTNNSGAYGGAIYSGDWFVSVRSQTDSVDLTFAGNVTEFEYNTASLRGGAISTWTSDSTQSLSFDSDYTLFNSNSSDYIGGAISQVNNYGGNRVDVAEGAEIRFEYNTAGLSGGAISIEAFSGAVGESYFSLGQSGATADQVTIKSNSVDGGYGGGAILLFTVSEVGAEDGIVFNIDAVTVDIGYNSALGTDETGTASGGAIYAKAMGSYNNISAGISAMDADLYSNSAVDSGGFFYGNKAHLSLVKVSPYFSFDIEYNSAQYGVGGAISNVDGTLLITGVTASSNTATDLGAGYGGFAHIDTGDTYGSRINDSYFAYNNAGVNGGAVNLKSGSLVVNSSIFSDNSAGERGGALAIYTDAFLRLDSNYFGHNSAGIAGGAMYTSFFGSAGSNRTQLWMQNNTVYENTADFVGGMSLGNTTYGTILHNTFAANTSFFGAANALYSSLAVQYLSLALAANVFAGVDDLTQQVLVSGANASDGGGNLFTGPAPTINGLVVENYDAALRDGRSFVVSLEQLDLGNAGDNLTGPDNDGLVPTIDLGTRSVAVDFIGTGFDNSPIWGLVESDARGVDRLDESDFAIWGDGLDAGAFESIHTFGAAGEEPEPESPQPSDPKLKITAVSKSQLSASGDSVVVYGVGLRSVDRVTVGGISVAFEVQQDGSLLLTTGALPVGVHTLVVTSEDGTATLLQAFEVGAEPKYWTKNLGDGQVRIYAKNVIGAGKVQFFVNGKEVAWVRAADESDPKLRKANGAAYLVRTVDLVAGKNRIEIKVDGVRVRFTTYKR